MSIRTIAVVTVWLTACALSACASQSSKAAPGAPSVAPEQALLTMDQVNAIVAEADPHAVAFHAADPVRHEPDAPWDGLAAPCAQVLPLYFGSGEPQFSRYVMSSFVGEGNVFANQLVVQYGSAAQADTKFTQLTKDIPRCVAAADADPRMGLALELGETTAHTARFQKKSAGANTQVANSHVVNNEYRLVGNAIIAVWATEPAAVVTTVADQLGQRLGS